MCINSGCRNGSISGNLRKALPLFEVPSHAQYSFDGVAGQRLKANLSQWILPAPAANPAMLEMFRDRDRTPDRNPVPWAGEFAGKYLISAVQALRINPDEALKAQLEGFVAELIQCQDDDGYLGPFDKERRLFGPNRFEPQACGEGLWDLWGHYHCLYGLYLWYLETGDQAAFDCCLRSADYLCRVFLDGFRRVLETKAEEMNQSSIHIFTLLYIENGDTRYLELAKHIEADWEVSPSGDYLRCGLAQTAFFETPKPRWESLPSIQGLGELYYITGDERYSTAMQNLWWSIVETDRHNTGGFSSGEQATGNPFDVRAIETCCTVAWMALCIDMLRLTGDPRAADELELSTFNATFGSQHLSGRWWTYNTPMDGVRKATPVAETSFQARPGSPELNCCSVNGPRSLGMLSEWCVMLAPDGLVVNYYGPSTCTLELNSGCRVSLTQQTDYPLSGRIELVVNPDQETNFALHLRIPGWSKHNGISINGQPVNGVKSGTYTTVERIWKTGDRVEIQLDMSPMLWIGERDCEGKASIYHGPILMAYDPRYDLYDPTILPSIDYSCEPVILRCDGPAPKPFLLLRYATEDGKGITLCDFASAGAAGNYYVSWFDASGFAPEPFLSDNPLRRFETSHFGGN